MAKENHQFTATPHFDDIEAEDAELQTRRVQTYSPAALKQGLRIDSIFVQHSLFLVGLAALDRVFQLARDVNMPHGFRLIGPTGVGKSALFRYFSESLPRSTLFTPGFGCLRIRAGAHPTAGQLIGALLRSYRYPFASVSEKTVYVRKEQALDLVRVKGTRLIFVDEAHNLMHQVRRRSNGSGEPDATVFLSELMDETSVALVLAGSKELDQLETVDSYLGDRVSGRVELCYFEPTAEWMAFLLAFSRACTWFDLRIIENPVLAKLSHIASGGSPRRLKCLLTEAVLIAAEGKCESVTVDHLRSAWTLVYGVHGQRTNPYG
jgi:Cdc6-like AAA superfamily ATPase